MKKLNHITLRSKQSQRANIAKSESTCEMNPNVCYNTVQPPKTSVAESSASCTTESRETKLSMVMSPEYDDVLPR